MSESFATFGSRYGLLNRALHDFKTEMTEKTVELMDAKLAKSNIRYEIINNGEGFTIKADEVLLNTIEWADFDSINDMVETFVDEIMVTDPEDEDWTDVYEPIDTSNVGVIEKWVVDVKLEQPENKDEKERVYTSPNPELEVSKIAMRIIRAQQKRKQLRLAVGKRGILGWYDR